MCVFITLLMIMMNKILAEPAWNINYVHKLSPWLWLGGHDTLSIVSYVLYDIYVIYSMYYMIYIYVMYYILCPNIPWEVEDILANWLPSKKYLIVKTWLIMSNSLRQDLNSQRTLLTLIKPRSCLICCSHISTFWVANVTLENRAPR